MSHFEAATPLRILMAVPQYPYPVIGGLERQAHELAKALSAEGARVSVVSGSMGQQRSGVELVEGITVYRIPWFHSRWLRLLSTTGGVIATMVRRRRDFDVVHNHNVSWFGALVIVIAKVLRKPVISKLPNVGEFGLPGMRSRPLGWLCQRIFLGSDAIVAMSAHSLAELREVGYPFERTFATPNGIVPSTRSAVARTLPTVVRVVFAGRLHEVKRLVDVIEVWDAIVERSTTPARLEIWGEGPQEQYLRALAARQSHPESIVFRGHVAKVREDLESADIFVLPSAAEGNSNAILEAMDAGLPVVSTDVGGTAMLVGKEGARYLFEPGARDKLVERLVMLLNDEALRETVGERMRARVTTFFAMRTIAAAYASVYVLLARRERGRIHTLANRAITGDL